MRTFLIFTIVSLTILSCDDITDCYEDISYTFTLTSTGGETIVIEADTYNETTVHEIDDLSNYTWGIRVEGTPGLTSVGIGRPGSCSVTSSLDRTFPADLPTVLIYNTGDPLLTGHKWEYISGTSLPRFDDLTAEGTLTTTVVRERFNFLIEIEGNTPDPETDCTISHLLEFQVVRD